MISHLQPHSLIPLGHLLDIAELPSTERRTFKVLGPVDEHPTILTPIDIKVSGEDGIHQLFYDPASATILQHSSVTNPGVSSTILAVSKKSRVYVPAISLVDFTELPSITVVKLLNQGVRSLKPGVFVLAVFFQISFLIDELMHSILRKPPYWMQLLVNIPHL